MQIFEKIFGEYLFSTDKSKLEIGTIHHFLSKESYWSQNIPLATVRKSLENSLCYGVYHQNRQIGFARIITDFATFAYAADVFIIDEFRGKDLSKILMETIISHPDLQGLRRWMLGTRDAHGLYAKCGFTPLAKPIRFMEKHNPEAYQNIE